MRWPTTASTPLRARALVPLFVCASAGCNPGAFDQLQNAAQGAAGAQPGGSGRGAGRGDVDSGWQALPEAGAAPRRDAGFSPGAVPAPSERDDAGGMRPGDASWPEAHSPDAGASDDAPAGSGGGGTGGSDASAPVDAASPDAGPPEPVGESACYTWLADRLVCEGFETTPRDPPWWTLRQNGELTHTGARTHTGQGAIAARTLVNGGNAFVGRVAYPGLTSGTIYLRSYVYVPSGVPLAGVIVHGLSEEREPYGGVSVRLDDAAVSLDVHPRGPGVVPLFISASPPVPLPRDRWNCLQLQLTISASQGSVRLTVNGQVAAASTGPLPTLPASGYRGVSAGIVYSDPDQQPIELFVDEVVADTAPIPCNLAVSDGGVGTGGRGPTRDPGAVIR